MKHVWQSQKVPSHFTASLSVKMLWFFPFEVQYTMQKENENCSVISRVYNSFPCTSMLRKAPYTHHLKDTYLVIWSWLLIFQYVFRHIAKDSFWIIHLIPSITWLQIAGCKCTFWHGIIWCSSWISQSTLGHDDFLLHINAEVWTCLNYPNWEQSFMYSL